MYVEFELAVKQVTHWEGTKGKYCWYKGAEGQKERALATGRDQHNVGLDVGEIPGYIQG